MSLTAQIASSDSSFKLSQNLVAFLAEKFGFKFEDGWNTVSSRSVDNVQKRLKRARRRANPASQVKHPRTAFSFFTQQQRPIEAGNHKDATFGELSRFVSEAWKALTPAQLQTYKDMEAKDKARYQTERDAALAAAPAPPASGEAAASGEVAAATTDAKPARKERKAKAVVSTTATTATTDAKPDKAPKATKAPKAVAAASTTAAAATPAAATPATAESKSAKAPKAPKVAKASSADAVAPVAAVAAAPVAASSTPAKASKAPKTAKPAGKA